MGSQDQVLRRGRSHWQLRHPSLCGAVNTKLRYNDLNYHFCSAFNNMRTYAVSEPATFFFFEDFKCA